jgi:hypothetical protein
MSPDSARRAFILLISAIIGLCFGALLIPNPIGNAPGLESDVLADAQSSAHMSPSNELRSADLKTTSSPTETATLIQTAQTTPVAPQTAQATTVVTAEVSQDVLKTESWSERVQRKGILRKGGSPTVLFVINTTESNYSTRVKDIRTTWMKRVLEKDSLEILFLGGPDNKGMEDMVPSQCKVGYWEDSCKKADAITAAYDFLQKPYGKRYDWVFLADDDVYLFPDNIQRMIVSLKSDPLKENKAWGINGCAHQPCVGFCGGGGYLLTRHALIDLEERVDRTQFKALRNETDLFDVECGRCGDLVMTRVMKERRGIEILRYPAGHYVWNFKNDEGLIDSLKSTDPLPFLYHYPSKGRMEFIHQKGIEFGSNKELED